MLSTGLVVYPEDEFEYAKERLIGCCNKQDPNKLKLEKYQDGSFKIYCSNCCASADGNSILEVINNYEFGNFTVYPY